MPTKRRRRPNWPLRLFLLGLLAICLIYVAAPPLFNFWQGGLSVDDPLKQQASRLRLSEDMRLRGVQVFMGCWFFFVGGAIGSFANVVVYRLPRGQSVISRDSACPHCKSRIKLRHNIPVFAWFILRGRCDTCGLPISPRYPIVEFCFGLVFLALYFTEFITAAANVPGAKSYPATGIANMILDPHWDVVAFYLFHCFLVSSLLTMALMRWDRARIPAAVIVIAGLVGLIGPTIWPFLHPVGSGLEFILAGNPYVSSLLGGVSGAGVGLIAAVIVVYPLLPKSERIEFSSLAAGYVLVGLFLGWQAVLAVGLVFSLAWLACKIVTVWRHWSRTPPPLLAWSAATLVFLLIWKPLAAWPFIPDSNPHPVEVFMTGGLTAAILLAARFLTRSELVAAGQES